MDKISGNKITGVVRPDGLSKQETGKPVKGSQIKDTFSHGVKAEPAGLMPKPAVEKKGKWTILKFTIVESGLGQELYDGLSMPGTKEDVKVVSAEISDAGRVEKNYSWNASGKAEEKALSGKDANFEDFLKAAMKKYPAQHYMIAFDGHSSQFRPLIPKLNNAMKETGKKFDIIQFSSCTMAEADIASQFKDTADYLIASESFSTSKSYLPDVKEWGNKNPEALNSAEKVAKKIIQEDEQSAQSVINLNKLESFNKEIAAFGKEILNVKNEDLKELRKVIDKSQHFAQLHPFHKSPLIDIGDLASRLQESKDLSSKYPGLIGASKKLGDKLKKDVVADSYYTTGGKFEFIQRTGLPLAIFTAGVGVSLGALMGLLPATVLSSALPIAGLFAIPTFRILTQGGLLYEDIKSASGMTVFLPTKKGYEDSYVYNSNLSFWKETGWDKVLEHVTA